MSNQKDQYLIMIDTETTGLDPMINVPLDITLIAYNVTKGEILFTYQTIISCSESEFKLSDPEALKVNGLTWEYIKTGLSRDKVRENILKLFNDHKISYANAKFFCQNPSFDKPFFSLIIDVKTQTQHQFPYYWLDLASMYWFYNVSHGKIPGSITLKSIAENLGLKPESTPHISMGGVKSLMECYLKLVIKQ